MRRKTVQIPLTNGEDWLELGRYLPTQTQQ